MSELWGFHHLEVEEWDGTSKEADKCGKEIQNCNVLEIQTIKYIKREKSTIIPIRVPCTDACYWEFCDFIFSIHCSVSFLFFIKSGGGGDGTVFSLALPSIF